MCSSGRIDNLSGESIACHELPCPQYILLVKSASSDHHLSTRIIDVVL